MAWLVLKGVRLDMVLICVRLEVIPQNFYFQNPFIEDQKTSPRTPQNKLFSPDQMGKGPSEVSCAAPAPKRREIPGLDTSKYKASKFGDIRFDPSFGKANEAEVRKNYKFLDQYRQEEIKRIEGLLKDPKTKKIMSQAEIEDLQLQAKSLKLKLDSLKNKDLANSVQRKVKSQYWKDVKEGKKGYYLKRSEQKKLIQVEKFKGMKKKQVDRVIERKRKRVLGREYKNVEFLKDDRTPRSKRD